MGNLEMMGQEHLLHPGNGQTYQKSPLSKLGDVWGESNYIILKKMDRNLVEIPHLPGKKRPRSLGRNSTGHWAHWPHWAIPDTSFFWAKDGNKDRPYHFLDQTSGTVISIGMDFFEVVQ